MSETICHYILSMRQRDPDAVALMSMRNKTWVHTSWQDYYQKIETIGTALLEKKIQPGDRVAIWAQTRAEWSFCDCGILGIGAITVPIYQNATAEEMVYVLNDSKAKILFIEGKAQLKIWQKVASSCPDVEQVIAFDVSDTANTEQKAEQKIEKLETWSQFLTLGKDSLKKTAQRFEKLCETRTLDEIATLIYTSGTTGQPKGVVLTHRQIMSEIKETFPYLGVTSADTTLSFLPYAHVLGRIEHWGHLYIGFTMAYAESIEKLKFNLRDVQPTLMIAVPRIFEKIYSAIWTQIETNTSKEKLFRWALSVGKKVSSYKVKRESIPLAVMLQYQIANKAVLHKIREALGGRIRFVVSGGAPLAKEVAEFFHAADVLILEGYGLTETTGAVCVNTPFDYKFGTVGKPLADVKIKIAEDGEILLKSDKVMKEYYQQPQETEKSFPDGWFATGDIGELLPSGHLRITDRKKDLIKTAGGKYVAPQKLEKILKIHPFISNILIHGDQKKYIVALLTLDAGWIKNWAQEQKITVVDDAAFAAHPKVQELVRKAIAQVNSELASFETIKNFAIIPQDFTVEAGDLTPSLKVRRKFLDQKHKALIDSLYPGGAF